MWTLTDKEKAQFVKAAKQAVAGLDKSDVMVGILDDKNTPERWQFTLQIGHCLLQDKPLILLVPEGMPLPERLRAAASLVETSRRGDPESVNRAAKRALTALDLNVVH